jgi:hypothetical protein
MLLIKYCTYTNNISTKRNKAIFGGTIPVVWSNTGRKLSMYMPVLTQPYLQKLLKESTTCLDP